MTAIEIHLEGATRDEVLNALEYVDRLVQRAPTSNTTIKYAGIVHALWLAVRDSRTAQPVPSSVGHPDNPGTPREAEAADPWSRPGVHALLAWLEGHAADTRVPAVEEWALAALKRLTAERDVARMTPYRNVRMPNITRHGHTASPTVAPVSDETLRAALDDRAVGHVVELLGDRAGLAEQMVRRLSATELVASIPDRKSSAVLRALSSQMTPEAVAQALAGPSAYQLLAQLLRRLSADDVVDALGDRIPLVAKRVAERAEQREKAERERAAREASAKALDAALTALKGVKLTDDHADILRRAVSPPTTSTDLDEYDL